MKSVLLIGILTSAALAVIAGCSFGDNPVAGGSEAGNARTVAVAGRAQYADSAPAVNAFVRLRAADYLAVPDAGLHRQTRSRADVQTDDSGRFVIDSVDTGRYVIEVGDSGGQAVRIDCRLDGARARVSLSPATLTATATVIGRIDQSIKVPGPTTILIYGLHRIAVADSVSGDFRFGDLPPGSCTFRVVPESTSYAAQDFTVPNLAAGETRVLDPVVLSSFAGEDYRQWLHSRTIRLNTTPGGADVSQSVTEFPLLVRLDAVAIDFAQTNPKGWDLRFSDVSGEHLPYQIEHWDAVARRAAVWVKIDTVAGGSSSQTVTMHWGNAGAPDFSRSEWVFDTADGFAGVWHMGDEARCEDATWNGNSGRSPTTAAAVDGVVGRARRFNGTGDYIDCGRHRSLAITDSLTIAVWVRLTDLKSNKYNRIVSKKEPWNGVDGYEMEINPRLNNTGGAFTVIGTDSGYVRSFFDWDSQWHYCCAVVAGDSVRLYRDGERVSAMSLWHGPLVGGDAPFKIGGIGANDFFSGEIDEVRVLSNAAQPSRIRLCYENQRANQKLVTFE